MRFAPSTKLFFDNEGPEKIVALLPGGDSFAALPASDGALVLPETARFADLPANILRIGRLDGRLCGAFLMDESAALPAGCVASALRSGALKLDCAEATALHRALELLYWRGRRNFCGACGAPMRDATDTPARHCPACGALYFPVIAPAIITLVTRGNELLLAHNNKFHDNMYGLIAGFVESGETLENAVEREIAEEVGIQVRNIRYWGSQSWPYPNSLMVGFRAEYAGGELIPDGVEIGDARWFAPDATPNMPKPGSIAFRMLDEYLSSFRKKGALEQ